MRAGPDEWQVGEVARWAGVTVRALHHYDRIGLLSPSRRTASGYRAYDAGDLARLQRVLGYRELGFGLDDIAGLLDDEACDPVERLRAQHGLVMQRMERLRRVAETLERTMEAHQMGIRLTPQELLEVFGGSDPTGHAGEAEERWGDTDSYRQSQRRTSGYTKEDWLAIRAEAEANTARLAALMRAGTPAGSTEAMDAAEAARQHICRWFYDCSPLMHAGLAEMYVADPRFTATYEDVAPGLAGYVRDAILANSTR